MSSQVISLMIWAFFISPGNLALPDMAVSQTRRALISSTSGQGRATSQDDLRRGLSQDDGPPVGAGPPSPPVAAWCPSSWHLSVLCARHGGPCDGKSWQPQPATLMPQESTTSNTPADSASSSAAADAQPRRPGGRHACSLPDLKGSLASDNVMFGGGKEASRRVTFVTALYDIKRGVGGSRDMTEPRLP